MSTTPRTRVSPGPSPADASVLKLVVRLRAVVGPLARQLRLQATHPLTATQFSALVMVSQYGPISLGDLAARERLSAPMISRVVVALEEHAFVARTWDRLDRRVCRVELTAEGERWMKDGETQRNRWLADRLVSLEPEDLAAVAAGLVGLERMLNLEVDDGATAARA